MSIKRGVAIPHFDFPLRERISMGGAVGIYISRIISYFGGEEFFIMICLWGYVGIGGWSLGSGIWVGAGLISRILHYIRDRTANEWTGDGNCERIKGPILLKDYYYRYLRALPACRPSPLIFCSEPRLLHAPMRILLTLTDKGNGGEMQS